LRADESAVKIFTGEEEHHIVSDVAYAVFKYIEASNDHDFLFNYGAEIIFQTARFWASRAEKRRDRYEVRKIVGPDEFHEHVDNNAFTNYLAMWNLNYAIELYKQIKKEDPEQFKVLVDKIKLAPKEIDEMEVIAKTIYFPYDQKTELIEQFEGYFSLDEVVIKQLDKNGLPRFPKGVDDSNVHRSQLIKQADVVLLLYLFLDRFSHELKKKNYKYYEARTMHKSSLSPCTYAIMGLETGDHKRAYDYFIKTSYIDLVDANRNTCDGIHAAATGGAWMTVIHGFGGMRVRMGKINFDPWLPKHWQELGYTFYWQGSYVKVKISHKEIIFTLLEGKSISVEVKGKTFNLKGLKRPVKIKLL
jgi:kojibiose phosphorylase